MNLLRKRLVTALAAAAITGLAVGGCTATAPAPTTAPAPVETNAAPEPATIKVLTGPVLFETLFIADEDGFFEEEGLTIEHEFAGSAAELVPQVVNGGVQISSANGISLLNAVLQGLPIKAFGGLFNTERDPIVSGILVREDSDIETYGDLAGKT